jgi:ADP-ribosylglycohydrolase
MLGAIIGDIVGSPYEFNNIKTTDFPLFSVKSRFTDDTVMTLAVAEALMEGGKAENYVVAMKKYGALYPNAGYGGRFLSWLASDKTKPYNSFGNGSAMRVSPVAWWYKTLDLVELTAAACDLLSLGHKYDSGKEFRSPANLSAYQWV